jgi:Skp family chaperone for outer membrane proteins
MIRRNKLNLPMLVLATAFVCLAGYQTMALRELARLQPAVIATVDLERIFNRLDERTAEDAALTNMANELQADINARAAALEELNEESKIYTPGTDQHQEVISQLALQTHELRAFIEWGHRRIEVKKSASLRRIYNSIKASVEREAREKGYDIVFVNDSIQPIAPSDEMETPRQITARRMLYSNPQLDVTQDVISRMNREFGAAAGR